VTQKQLEAIRSRCDAATAGPWAINVNATSFSIVTSDNERLICAGVISFDDAGFIIDAREDVPTLLAEVERLRAEREVRHERVTPKAMIPHCKLRDVGYCPICKTELLTDDDDLNYCPSCGQRLLLPAPPESEVTE